MRRILISILCVFAVWTAASADNFNSTLYNARKGMSSAMNQLGVWYYTGNNVDRDFNAAFYWWSQGALKQNPKAIANLGVCYQYGRGVQRDSLEAVRLYQAAIAAGRHELLEQRQANVNASSFDAMLVGSCYEKGIGTASDIGKATDFYLAAADKGSADGVANAGRLLAKAGQSKKALDYLKKAADAGNHEAAYLAASLMMKDNKPTAIKYLTSAADADVPEAQNLLGKTLLSSSKNEKTTKEALSWLKKSAENGCAEGMWNYANAITDSNPSESLFWFAEAAQAGYLEDFIQLANSLPSSSSFRNFLEGMRQYLVNGNFSGATAYFKKAEKDKSADAKAMRLILMADSSNPDANVSKAVSELNKIAYSNPLAATALAKLYIEGDGVDRNSSKAISLLRTAVNAGYAPAQLALANLYFDGKYTTKDLQGAADLYKKAFSQRRLSNQGRQRLLELFADGVSVDSNLADALNAYIPTDANVVNLLQGRIAE